MLEEKMSSRVRWVVIISLLPALGIIGKMDTRVPLIWDDASLAEWATPVAGLNIRPAHFTQAEYYKVPATNFRTFAVYHPEREPSGYWDKLQKTAPAPLVDAAVIKTDADWIAAGERAFSDLDIAVTRSNNPKLIAMARDPQSFKDVYTQPDGSLLDMRWVVTDKGLMLTTTNCSSCHFRIRPDRSLWLAAPAGPPPFGRETHLSHPLANMLILRAFQTHFPDNSLGLFMWGEFVTPWAPDPRVETMRDMSPQEVLAILASGSLRDGVQVRTNGSPYYQAKIPDLHTLRYSRYLDATGTHRLRGAADIARYAALVDGADPLEFGPYRIRARRRIPYRDADEVLHAIGMYLMSLEPPRNPDIAPKEVVDRGEAIFRRERCDRCHTPPAYTSGKLAPVEGFAVPADHPNAADVISDPVVGTDPGLALKTRKGTGFYKVPSLRGVWYRPRLLHDASVASIEEIFDPARLREDHVPGGWKGPGVKTRAIRGHSFSLRLPAEEKADLFAFLRSL
jgi:hypothetical protein